MGKNTIQDGYTRRGYMNGDDGLFEPIEFEYRPLLAEEVARGDAVIEKANAEQEMLFVAGIVQEKLVSWSEEGCDGLPLPITLDNVRRLPFVVLIRIHKIMCGVMRSDPLKDPSEQEQLDIEREIRGVLRGNAPGAEIEEGDRKN